MKKIYLIFLILIILGIVGHFIYDDKEPIQIGDNNFDVTFQKIPNKESCLVKMKIISKINDYNVQMFTFKIRDLKNTVFDIQFVKVNIKKNIPIEESKIIPRLCSDIQKPSLYILK